MRWLPGQLATPVGGFTQGDKLAPRWVSRGLVLVVHDGLWITPAGSRAMTATGAIIRRPGKHGVARRLGDISLGLTNCRYDGFFLPNSTNGRRSWFGSVLARSVGAAGLGRVSQDASGAGGSVVGEEALYFVSNRLTLTKTNTSGGSVQVSATANYPIGEWSSFGFSCRFTPGATITGDEIDAYVNGTRDPRFINNNAGGQFPTGAGCTMVFGNRPSDMARSWDGELGIIAAFDSELTAAEHASLHANPSQLLERASAPAWAPSISVGPTIYRPSSDLSVAGWTFSGAASVAAAIGETAASDAEFATSPNLADPATVAISPSLPAGTWAIKLRPRRNLAGVGQVRVRLLNSSNVDVGGSNWITPTTSFSQFEVGFTTTGLADRLRIEVQP